MAKNDPRDARIEELEESIKWHQNDKEKLKNAIWQYLLDHSTYNSIGRRVIKLAFIDQRQFWFRVNARAMGTYKIVEVEKEEELQAYIQSKVKEKGFVVALDFAEQRTMKEGKLKDKILFKIYRKLEKYLIKL